MDKHVLNLLRKYLADQCSNEELEQIRTILLNGDHEEEWEHVLKEEAEGHVTEYDTDLLDKQKEEQLLGHIMQSAGIKEKPASIFYMSRRWISVAASVLMLMTAGIVFYVMSSGNTVTTSTKAGEQAEVVLADGTRVVLNDQSSLVYPKAFDGNDREVHLEGQAYFEVASDPAKPFIVQTRDLRVQVLGTSFNVRSYENDAESSVSVAEGRVRVSSPEHSQAVDILLAGDRLIYNKVTRQIEQLNVPVSDIRSLKEGRLIFRDQPLGDIIRALERRYSITFHVEEETAKKQRLTFKPNSSDLDEVLQVLSLASGLQYELKGREVYMK